MSRIGRPGSIKGGDVFTKLRGNAKYFFDSLKRIEKGTDYCEGGKFLF
jgi:hypothetical protein